MTQHLALMAHLLGVILWIGGGAVAATIAANVDGDRKALGAARKAMLQWSTPGMLLAWAGGLTMLIPNFSVLMTGQGFMHAKLTVLVLLSGATGVLSARIRKAAAGDKEAPAGLLHGLSLALVVGALIVLVLVVLRPF